MKEFIFDLQRFDDEDTTDTTTDDTTDDTTTDDTSTTEDITTSGDMLITAGGTQSLASGYTGTITIDTAEPVTIVGTEGTPLTAQIVTGTNAANLTIDSLNLSSTGNAVKFGKGGGTLTLVGNNTLTTSGTNSAALNIGGGVTINGTGYLTATAPGYGAGVGTDYGEVSTANLTVQSGVITATSNYGAGVGSGFQSSVGTIAIAGGSVNAKSSSGAGIGTGAGTGDLTNAGTINITGGNISATSQDGAAIGSGFGGSVGNISIGGNAGVNAVSTGNGAGIGSGAAFGNTSSAGNITINGAATVTATSATNGAGIGSGYAQYSGTNSAGTISIGGDATVTASSISSGVGIGAGNNDGNSTNTVGAISIAGDNATPARSMVVIDNSNTTRETTINGAAVSGIQLVYVDGINTNATDATDTLTGTIDTAPAAAVNEIVYGTDVTGVTNVGKVEGSDDYIYLGGVGVISDYEGVIFTEEGENGAKIRYAPDCMGFNYDGENLAVNCSSGTLIVQNCKDKIISIADIEGNTNAYVYSPTAGGVTYGNLLPGLEVVVGSALGSDYIFAGDGGSTLWGGFGAYDDTMAGGLGRDEFVYIDGGGNDVIVNYGNTDVIRVGGTVNGVNLFGNFALNFSDGMLTLVDYQDKIITVTDGAGNIAGQACYASGEAVLDGRGLVGKEVLVGGAFGSNLIIAGNGGSSLWGGFGGVNTLVGGGGSDEFIYTAGSGVVFAQNANAFDSVNLYGVTFNQIADVVVTATDTTISFTDGGLLNVQGSGLTYKIEGATYVANAQTGTLTQV